MKAVTKKRQERSTEELAKEFKGSGGKFSSFWSGLSLTERERFKGYLSSMRPPE
jgi:hypothetical protein